MPYDARAVGNFLIDAAIARNVLVTHLGLQKIIYFAHAWHLAKYDRPLVGQRFEAWQYGPVVRVIFDQLKRLKDKPIDTKLLRVDRDSGNFVEFEYDFSDLERKFLENIFDYYGNIDPRKLVDLTHDVGGPWEKVWKSSGERSVVGMYIPDQSIKLWILREGRHVGKLHH